MSVRRQKKKVSSWLFFFSHSVLFCCPLRRCQSLLMCIYYMYLWSNVEYKKRWLVIYDHASLTVIVKYNNVYFSGSTLLHFLSYFSFVFRPCMVIWSWLMVSMVGVKDDAGKWIGTELHSQSRLNLSVWEGSKTSYQVRNTFVFYLILTGALDFYFVFVAQVQL